MPRIEVNGVTLNVTQLPQHGRGADCTPIVYIHGLAASQAFWYMAGAQLLTRLGPGILYDLRGHGKSELPETGFGVASMADDLLGLLDALEIDQAHLVAHSFGGMIALLATLRQPARVRSLVLADVRVRPLQKTLDLPIQKIPVKLAERLAQVGIDTNTISNHDDGIDYLKTVAKIQIAAGDDANALLRELYHHPKLFRNKRTAERWIALTERASFVEDLKEHETFQPEDLATIGQPMLVVVGGESTTGPSARALARICPNTRLHVVPGVGHFFPITQPRLFLRPAARFLRAVNAGRTDVSKPRS